MDLAEIRLVATEIKDQTETFAKRGNSLIGGCARISYGMAIPVETIIHNYIPRLRDHSISLVAGNYSSAGQFLYPKQECEQTVLALDRIDPNAYNVRYHVWLEIDETVIDLTYLHSMGPHPQEREIEEQPIYYTKVDGWLPYTMPLDPHSIKRFNPPRPDGFLTSPFLKDIDVSTRTLGVGEKRVNLLGSVKKLEFPQWKSAWNRAIRLWKP
jgi:hypothetical protein